MEGRILKFEDGDRALGRLRGERFSVAGTSSRGSGRGVGPIAARIYLAERRRSRAEKRRRRVHALAGVVSVLAVVALIVVVALLMFYSPAASAATINVGAGQTIQSGINAAAAGDVVVVASGTAAAPVVRTESIVLNKSVTVKAAVVGGVVLRGTSGKGIDIQCSNCGVEGITFENFGQAAGSQSSGAASAGRSNVVLRDLVFRNAGNGIWVNGTGWVLERIELHCRMRGGEDYINAFGSGHTFRRLFCWGVQPADLRKADWSYLHNDCIQTWTAGGAQGLKNTLIAECIFTDFAQAIYLHNEAGTSGAISGITVEDCVLWGVDFPRSGATWPSHGVRMTGPNGTTPMIVRRNLLRHISSNLRFTNLSGPLAENNIVTASGTVYSLENTTGLNRGAGNLLWDNSWVGNASGAPDVTTINPQVQNPNAKGRDVLGPDGQMFTADDAWRPLNAAASGKGPQVNAGPQPPVNRAPVAVNDTAMAAWRSPGVVIAVLANDSDPDGDAIALTAVGAPSLGGVVTMTIDKKGVVYVPATTNTAPVVETFSYTVGDGKGGSATATVNVSVEGPPPPAVFEWFQVQTVGGVTVWVSGTRQAGKPVEAP